MRRGYGIFVHIHGLLHIFDGYVLSMSSNIFFWKKAFFFHCIMFSSGTPTTPKMVSKNIFNWRHPYPININKKWYDPHYMKPKKIINKMAPLICRFNTCGHANPLVATDSFGVHATLSMHTSCKKLHCHVTL